MKRIESLLLFLFAVVLSLQAKNYQNFKVSTYIRAQDVARMADDIFLESTWRTISEQYEDAGSYIYKVN